MSVYRRRLAACVLAFCTSALSWQVTGSDSEPAFRNWRAMRDAGVVRQARDYSCGAAALATLLQWLGREDVTEALLLAELESLRARQGKPAIVELAPSLAELAGLAESRGFATAGLAVSREALDSLRLPALVYLEHEGWQHFSVLRGWARRDGAELADPSWGNRRLAGPRFEELFLHGGRGTLLLIVDPAAPRRLAGRFRMSRPRALLGTPGSLAPPGARS